MSARLTEDEDERRMFNQGAEVFGGVLPYIANVLTVWFNMAAKDGSYRKMLAIMVNEIRAVSNGQTGPEK